MHSTDDLLTSPQVSQELGVSIRTVHRLAVAGDLQVAQKLPGPRGAFLFHPSTVADFKRHHDAAQAASA